MSIGIFKSLGKDNSVLFGKLHIYPSKVKMTSSHLDFCNNLAVLRQTRIKLEGIIKNYLCKHLLPIIAGTAGMITISFFLSTK